MAFSMTHTGILCFKKNWNQGHFWIHLFYMFKSIFHDYEPYSSNFSLKCCFFKVFHDQKHYLARMLNEI